MHRSARFLLAGLLVFGCGPAPVRSVGVAPGTFVATLGGAAQATLQGQARWFQRPALPPTRPRKESFITLRMRPNDAARAPDTLILLYRVKQPFVPGHYRIHKFRSDNDPVAQVTFFGEHGVVRGWDSTGGALTITRSDPEVSEGEFVIRARNPGQGQEADSVVARGSFSAIREEAPS